MLKVVIVEDELLAQKELKRLLQNSGVEVEVLECLESVTETVEWFGSNTAPDAVFMDIQLADGLSFEIFAQTKIEAPVIFTTAYDEYAIQAFKVNSVDYLLKPVEPIALRNALDKLIQWRGQYANQGATLSVKQLDNLLELVQPKKEFKTRMLVKVGDQIKFIPLTDVAYFYAEDNEVMMASFDKKRHVIDFSLDQLTESINPQQFYRLNRGILANKQAIGKIHRYFNSRLKIELIPELDSEVLVSRVKVSGFLEWMEV